MDLITTNLMTMNFGPLFREGVPEARTTGASSCTPNKTVVINPYN